MADTFHLFFPTSIKTHLPFLLHAYFEVDAGRKSFADAKKRDNEARLSGLGSLAVDAVRHLVAAAEQGEIDLSGLPAVFAATDGDPDDPLAAEFRTALLAELDLVRWVRSTGGSLDFAAPRDLLVDDRGRLTELLPIALPADYIWRRAGRVYPLIADSAATAFLAKRNALARNQDGDGLSGKPSASSCTPRATRSGRRILTRGSRRSSKSSTRSATMATWRQSSTASARILRRHSSPSSTIGAFVGCDHPVPPSPTPRMARKRRPEPSSHA